jgi:hypothetical protein
LKKSRQGEACWLGNPWGRPRDIVVRRTQNMKTMVILIRITLSVAENDTMAADNADALKLEKEKRESSKGD